MSNTLAISNKFQSQTNKFFRDNETHTLGRPLVELLLENKKCEVADYIQTEKGIVVSVRAKPNISAASVLRSGLEELIEIGEIISSEYHKKLAKLEE